MNGTIETTVKGWNEAVKVKGFFNKEIYPILKEYEGKKIFLKNGELTKKVKEKIYLILRETDLKIHRFRIERTLYSDTMIFMFTVMIAEGNTAFYYDFHEYIGKQDKESGKMISVQKIDIPKRYNADEVKEQIEYVSEFIQNAYKQYKEMTANMPYMFREYIVGNISEY